MDASGQKSYQEGRAAMKKLAYVGIDYHLDFLAIAVVIEGQKKIHETVRIANQDKVIRKYLKKLSKGFRIQACYEASCNGYAFHRKMKNWGYPCDVIAPSLIPKKRGDRRKNDTRDARNLAKLYANGLLTIVRPPTEQEESVRSLIRCRMSFKDNAKRIKQQINSLLLTQGARWESSKWTAHHLKWLRDLQLSDTYLQEVLQEHLAHLEYLQSRLDHFEQLIEQIANSDVYAPSVKRLKAFRGIGTLGAMVLIAEITDFARFPNPKALMAYLGLVSSENSSGGKEKGGSITKTGNQRCRKQLVESAQHCVKRPYLSAQMKAALAQLDARSAQIAIECMKRLHKRFWALSMKGKIRPVAIVAIAREFVGFIWAMMQPVAVSA
jgi:transposase